MGVVLELHTFFSTFLTGNHKQPRKSLRLQRKKKGEELDRVVD